MLGEIPEAVAPQQSAFLRRLLNVASADDRFAALFLGGSYAAGTADEHSDLDVYLITTDAAFEDVRQERHDLLRSLGEALFLEEHSFFGFLLLLYMYADGVEGEMALAPERDLATVHSGPYRALLDKTGVLQGHAAGSTFGAEQRAAAIHEAFTWFWYYRRHLDVALARGHLWTAHSFLERCRERCLQLLWLQALPDSWPGDHEKAERVLDARALERLAPTIVPLESDAIAHAGARLTVFHRGLGAELGERYGVAYPARLGDAVESRARLVD